MNSLQTTSQNSLVPADVEPVDLQVALAGDLSRLTPDAKLKFYGAICQTTGLNPLTKPFDWLTFQGKQVLYANKGCAEQLRKIHGVTIEIVERKVEFGCLVVRVKATDKQGRIDESIAAVPFNDKAGGDAAAVAMMKCETKAKRRVTLSICGLGMFDESELDSIRKEPSAVVSAMNGEGSAAARADEINSRLNKAQKEKAVEVEVVTEPPKPEPIPEPVAEPKPEPVAEPVEPPKPVDDFSTPEALTDAEVMKLEAALTDCANPQRAVDYIVYRGWLKKGEDLSRIHRNAFVNITTKKPAFVRMVDAWRGN